MQKAKGNTVQGKGEELEKPRMTNHVQMQQDNRSHGNLSTALVTLAFVNHRGVN